MRSSSLFVCAVLARAITANGQGIEKVIVETYCVQPALAEDSRPITTYRIFIDLAPEYRLEMLYGDGRHQLYLFTDAWFQNDTASGERYAHRVDGGRLDAPLALDSWLTIGAASNAHMGVPKELDTDGSIFIRPPAFDGEQVDRRTLYPSDGLIDAQKIPEMINFHFDPGYLWKTKGQLIETTNGAWAVPGGMKGPTEENVLLVAQLTTTGDLSFSLNIQVKAPDGRVEKFVARDAGEGEILFDGLRHGRDYHEYFR